jgi:hypothetical protein
MSLQAILHLEDASSAAQPSQGSEASSEQENEPPTLHTGGSGGTAHRQSPQPSSTQPTVRVPPSSPRDPGPPAQQQQQQHFVFAAPAREAAAGPQVTAESNGHAYEQHGAAAEAQDMRTVHAPHGTADSAVMPMGQSAPAAAPLQRPSGMRRGFFGASKPSPAPTASSSVSKDAGTGSGVAAAEAAEAHSAAVGDDSSSRSAATEQVLRSSDISSSSAAGSDAGAEAPSTPRPSTPQAPQRLEEDMYEAAKVCNCIGKCRLLGTTTLITYVFDDVGDSTCAQPRHGLCFGRCAKTRRPQLHLLIEQASCCWRGTWRASSDR